MEKYYNNPTIESICDGVPVYSFNNIIYVYGQSPDLYPGIVMQTNNGNPVSKIKLKKSWEIKHNYAGIESEMTPRTSWNEAQPFLPVHLIDGNPDTIWCSWGCYVPDGHREWIRIDLPAEKKITSVSLVCAKDYTKYSFPIAGRSNYGRALPKDLEIRVSRDAWHWDTVFSCEGLPVYKSDKSYPGYDSCTGLSFCDSTGGGCSVAYIKGDPADPDGLTVNLNEAVYAKQIWILADNLRMLNETQGNSWIGHVFSIAGVEVYDTDNINVALISRGAGVTVSSTMHTQMCDRYTQDSLWGPLQYDLGNKWLRVGGHNGSYLWCFTEHEKGKLEVDRRFDEAITEVADKGINVILCLDAISNWIYNDPPRKTDWFQARFKELSCTYEDFPGNVGNADEATFQAYLRYVDYMAGHFRDRVTYFEIANEWEGVNVETGTEWDGVSLNKYLTRIFEPTYEAIKSVAPDAKIMFGNSGYFLKQYLINVCGPGVTVRENKLAAAGTALLCAKGIEKRNLVVKVDTDSEVRVGFALRVKSLRNHQGSYLAAVYDPVNKNIHFYESDYSWGIHDLIMEPEQLDVKPCGDMGRQVHLEVSIEDYNVILTVSDGKKSVTAAHTVKKITDAGSAGIIHFPADTREMAAAGVFSNFMVGDLQGNPIFRDDFRDKDTTKKNWDIYWNYWGSAEKLPPGLRVDAIGWHSGDSPDSKYFKDVRLFQNECRKLGFKGKFLATEIYTGAGYPPGPYANTGSTSDIGMAKYLTRSLVGYSGLDMETGPCHVQITGFQTGQPICRTTWPVQTIVPCQPTPSYYSWRNTATALDDFYGAEFEVEFSDKAGTDITCSTMRSGDGKQLMVGAWLSVPLGEALAEIKTDITIKGIRTQQAWVIDIFNGTEQELVVTARRQEPAASAGEQDTVLRGILVKDYPVLIRLELEQL